MCKNEFKPDIILKDFWRNNDRFADLFNTVFFEGKQIILPELLEDDDTDVSGVLQTQQKITALDRRRDIVKKTAFGVDFMILALENQQKIHYAMPLRKMLYDGLEYLKEYKKITEKYSRFKKHTNDKLATQKSVSQTSDEFLSGMKKEDRLHPILSIVLYYGEDEWDGPHTLADMMVDMPESIRAVFSDYTMHLVQIRDSEKYHFSNPEVEAVFSMCNFIYNDNQSGLIRTYEKQNVSMDVLQTVIAVTNTKSLLSKMTVDDKGGVNMCRTLEKWYKEAQERGEADGRAAGMKAGMKAGMEAGMEAGRKSVLEDCARTIISLSAKFHVDRQDIFETLVNELSISNEDASIYLSKYLN